MNRISRIAATVSKSAPTWRLLGTLATLGLIALGAAAPGDWGFP